MAAPRPTRPPTPPMILVLGVFAVAYLTAPILALAARVPWAEATSILADPAVRQLLRITLSAACLSTVISLVLGVPLALSLRSLRRGAGAARLLVLLPLAMPPVVSGLALSAAIGNNGLLGPVLTALGWQFAFRFAGVVAAHVFVSLPFVVVTVDAALRQQDAEVAASAAGIGMGPARILRLITLPTAAPAIATGAGLAFARSLGEFGTTITFAGSMPGVTRTLSLAVYLEREVDRDSAYLLSALLILLAVAGLTAAALPQVLRREPAPQPREISPMDTARLRALTAPDAGAQVTFDGTEFPAGQLTAVIGPNGSGKSTLMAQVAGRLSGAEVRIDGRRVDTLAAHRRGVVLLTQKPGLPGVSTVAGAVDMATRNPARTRELLAAAGLASLTDVPVPSLSGGQAAQVALVRALAVRPRVLILDEPLAAVDVTSAARWRQLLRVAAADRTTVMVTHDPLDVAGLSERLVVMENGQVVAAGETGDVLAVPPTDFVAKLTGLNRLTGIVSGIGDDAITVSTDHVAVVGVLAPGAGVEVGEQAVATVAPEAITLRLPGAAELTSARNVWPGTVTAVNASTLAETVAEVSVGDAVVSVPVTSSSARTLGLEPGVAVECVSKALSVRIHPRPAPRIREGHHG